MAHYAELDSNNIVIRVIPGVDEREKNGEYIYKNYSGNTWKRTSYNTREGKHISGGTPFRKNYAGLGYFYDEIIDAFIPPKPDSISKFILDEDKCIWVPPFLPPDDGKSYTWNNEAGTWDEVTPIS